MPKVDIKSYSEEELVAFFAKLGQKPYRTHQVLDWIYNRDVKNFSDMSNIKKDLREKLENLFTLYTMEEYSRDVSNDGTVKWLFKTHDGHFIETVMIPAESRNSICVSTQVGCAMACTFCRTGKMGLKRHLECGEILEQFLIVRQYLTENELGPLTNLIYMGMGEPFHNYDNVASSAHWLNHQKYLNISKRRITVSTSGIAPKIIQMADEKFPGNLALSLNGTNDKMRSATMPINGRYDMKEVLAAVDHFLKVTGNYVTFEYVLIKNITCTAEAAHELKAIIHDRRCKINAIALNPGDDPTLLPPSPEEIEEFLEIIRTTGKHITVRQPRGRDIKAACGQLAVKKNQQPEKA
jgi:23S rRNA (adenine2503-C2)-methyltransferase